MNPNNPNDFNNKPNEIILNYLRVNGTNVGIKSLPFRYTVGYDVTSDSMW